MACASPASALRRPNSYSTASVQVHRTTLHVLVIGATVLLVGCKREPIRVYTVDSDPEIKTPSAVSTVSLPDEIPDGWQAEPPTGVRKASFKIPVDDGDRLDVSVISFPGTAGGLAPNVNRWRDELGLDLLSPANVAADYPETEIGELTYYIADLKSEERATLGAMLPVDTETWFVKLSGAVAEVEAQRDAFFDYLSKFQSESGANADPAKRFAAGDPEMAEPPDKPTLEYETPEGWEAKELGMMRVASFTITGENDREAEVAVIPLGGSGGNDLGNVNQWHTQMGLDPVTEDQLPELLQDLPAGEHLFKTIELAAKAPLPDTNRKRRLLVAFLRHEGRTWFFKLIGDDELVSEQKDAFLKFLESAKF